jgi:hypothetical protein
MGGAVLGPIVRSGPTGNPPTLLAMDIDAALTLVSFVGFAGLVVSWIVAPLRAAAPTAFASEAASPAAVAA